MYAVGEPDLIEDLERRGMNRVTPEFAVEIAMHLQQRDPHTSPRQQQSEHRSGGSASGNAASRGFNRVDRSLSRRHGDRCLLHLMGGLQKGMNEKILF